MSDQGEKRSSGCCGPTEANKKVKDLADESNDELPQIRQDEEAPTTARGDESTATQVNHAAMVEQNAALVEQKAAMQVLVEQNAALVEEHAAMAEECAAIDEISLKTLLSLENSDKLTVTKVESDSSHTQSAHLSATAEQKPFELSDIDTAHIRQSDVSLLLHKVIRVGLLSVGSRANVGVLVHKALTDTLQLLKATHNLKLTIHMERNLFSCRPDLLVVSTQSFNLPLFAIEVKDYKDQGLFDKPKVLGQLFDYAEMLAACGHKLPFVVLSNFKQSVVYSIHDDETATDLAADKSLRYKGADASSSSPPDTMSKPAELSSASPPLSKARSTSSDNEDAMPHEFRTTSRDRKLNRSAIYSAHELVPLLYSAILCALKGINQICPPKSLHW